MQNGVSYISWWYYADVAPNLSKYFENFTVYRK